MKPLAALRADALEIYRAALRAADPRAAVRRVMQRDENTLRIADQTYDLARGRVRVIGAGKAGAPMAQAVEEVLAEQLESGAIIVKYGHTAPTQRIKIYEAGHPLPDLNGVRATQAVLELLRGLTENDLVLGLISGGGSALFELPVAGVTLDDLGRLTDALLRCGATINEINTLRKHLSQVKGGQLARWAQPASIIALILSDVLGSPLDVIASGPTVPDPTTFADALGVLEKYRLRAKIPASILTHLERGARGEIPDTPKAEDRRVGDTSLLFARVTNVIIADNEMACQAARAEAEQRGYVTRLLSTQWQGEARALGIALAQQALAIAREERTVPVCLLAGGEPTVTVRGTGKGGRAQELTLAAAREIAGVENIVVLSAGTDGTDGPTDAAGALADGTTLMRARQRGMDADAYLANNDSYSFFQALGDLIITGPTNTNVNDLMLALVGDRSPRQSE